MKNNIIKFLAITFIVLGFGFAWAFYTALNP